MNFYDALSNSKPNPHKPEQELNIHKGFVREAVVVARAYHDMVHKALRSDFVRLMSATLGMALPDG